MSSDALANTTDAFQRLLEQAIGDNQVYAGPPIRREVGQRRASLFLFHIEPNAELRNAERFAQPAALAPETEPSQQFDALPLDLRYLITVFRTTGGGGGDPSELTTLGQIIQALHEQPTLGGSRLPDQLVRLTPEPYPMEELSRVWGLFPEDPYRTSMVYLATPVYVETGPLALRPPVLRREQRSGLSTEAPDVLGRRREERDEEVA